eukprot:TRINITY_DN21105_c0_g1_i1.p1 TRINITY_DN21105_c0_g1~~TRINITY_DN21105_c0_g1_i1.p1  ORF type:complete len:116 (-),score=23.79 TRINITY_DN21105_c0_g1_i1:37-384(-)
MATHHVLNPITALSSILCNIIYKSKKFKILTPGPFLDFGRYKLCGSPQNVSVSEVDSFLRCSWIILAILLIVIPLSFMVRWFSMLLLLTVSTLLPLNLVTNLSISIISLCMKDPE